ncbi:GAS2 domain containing protein [Metarhizium album ARSEF 1941]|uniref:GAS2 domain containing protein n=1 Tax=Metarhizium album (strain ARSEF 1941) TaxID=1081103 RepID=A0A0B2WQJ8_METAS|nr:GAS2 domain containing protein [Metarhizium album ARSEF 1941]KHN95757.1 GAS2 domain containing protein [Metarhizium album ARSEF 1941]
MSDSPFRLKPKRLSLVPQSPARPRPDDDIFSHLSPNTAIAALCSGNGPLRACLDGASAAERDLAMRAALASQRVCEWTDELSEWKWPVENGCAGFVKPRSTLPRLSFHVNAPHIDEREYIGCLPARDVALYRQRIAEIHGHVDDLALEEIKTQVLTNHILPLSRPNTPLSISRNGLPSTNAYTKMEDLSAVVTTIVVQMLPNLSRLDQLLRIWSCRLDVLQRVPPLLYALEDAEAGVKAGWAAISKPLRRSAHVDGKGAVLQKPTLNLADFNVMNKVLVDKVAAPGRALDYMLDTLEGMDDTLPDTWLERMEAVERSYSEWVAACERKIRETEWSKSAQGQTFFTSPSPQAPREVADGMSSESSELFGNDSGIAIKSPVYDKSDGTFTIPVDTSLAISGNAPQLPANGGLSSPGAGMSQYNRDQVPRTPSDPGSFDSELTRESSTEADESKSVANKSSSVEHDMSGIARAMSPVDEEEEGDEADLPALQNRTTRHSNSSEDYSMMHGDGHMGRFDLLTSDLPEVSASPPVPRDRIREAQFVDDSPPSSPPLPLGDTGDSPSPSGLLDSPVILPGPEDDRSVFDKTLADGSFVDDFDDSMSVSEVAGPTYRRESTGDKQLRQQISEIIESIPAKIKLAAETPAVNLNPPDLQLPRIKKESSKEMFKRSTSGLSSGTATPSFTLSPARNTRLRAARGQREIKVYHLSRSTGEPPIKLFIRCVGEHGERVMVRVGGGWADLSEYLKEYASHHGRRSAGKEKAAKIEVQDVPRGSTPSAPGTGSSPPNRPASAAAVSSEHSPVTPLNIRKTRRSIGAANSELPKLWPKTPAPATHPTDTPSSEESTRSRPGSRLSWFEDDGSFLGLAGPTGKKVEMSEENKAWVESVKEKVRQVSGERRIPPPEERSRFGDLGRVGGTKRLFRKAAELGSQGKR